MELLIQAIGLMGILMGVLSFQSNEHKKILLFRIFNEFFFAVQYALLGSYTGCIVNLIVCVRNGVFSNCVQTNRKTVLPMLVFCCLFIIIGLLTWEGFSSIIVITTKIISTMAFAAKNPRILRFLNLLAGIEWLLFNIMVGSYAGILCELLTVSSITVAIARFDILPKLSFRKSVSNI